MKNINITDDNGDVVLVLVSTHPDVINSAIALHPTYEVVIREATMKLMKARGEIQ